MNLRRLACLTTYLVVILGSLCYAPLVLAQTTSTGSATLGAYGGSTLIIIGDIRLLGPTVLEVEGRLECGGNFFSVPSAIVTGNGELVLNGDSLQELNIGQGYLNRLTIDNPNGVSLMQSLYINDTLILGQGHLYLGDQDLIIGPEAVIVGANASQFIVTNGTGMLIYSAPGARLYPVGAEDGSYHPALVTRDSSEGQVGIRVVDQVAGVSGVQLATLDSVIETTWIVAADSAVEVSRLRLIWNEEDMPASFLSTSCRAALWQRQGWEIQEEALVDTLSNGQFYLDHSYHGISRSFMNDSLIITSGFTAQGMLIGGMVPIVLNLDEAGRPGEIHVFPNPADDFALIVLGEGYPDQLELKLMDLTGNVVLNEDFLNSSAVNLFGPSTTGSHGVHNSLEILPERTPSESMIKLSLDRIPNGLYYFSLQSGDPAFAPVIGKLMVIHE